MFTESLATEVGNLPGVEEVRTPQGLPGPRYNLAPTQIVPAVRLHEGLAQIDPARWGLLPAWKKDESGPPLFNARAETVRTKPSFRSAFKAQRCIVPMNGYYEWHDDGTGKAAYYVTRGEGLLWAAGLWETGLDRLSVTIVTTAATEEMAWLHDRLPRFLAEDEVLAWTSAPPAQAAELLEPSGLRGFQARKADKAVGNVSNDYPGLIAKD